MVLERRQKVLLLRPTPIVRRCIVEGECQGPNPIIGVTMETGPLLHGNHVIDVVVVGGSL